MARALDHQQPRAGQRRRQRPRVATDGASVSPATISAGRPRRASCGASSSTEGCTAISSRRTCASAVRPVLEESLAHQRGVARREPRALAPHEALAGGEQPFLVERLRERGRPRRDARSRARRRRKRRQHQPLHALRMREREAQGDARPHREAAHHRALGAGLVERAREVGDEALGCIVRRPPPARRCARARARRTRSCGSARAAPSAAAGSCARCRRTRARAGRSRRFRPPRRGGPTASDAAPSHRPRIRSRSARMPSVRMPSASSARAPASPP